MGDAFFNHQGGEMLTPILPLFTLLIKVVSFIILLLGIIDIRYLGLKSNTINL